MMSDLLVIPFSCQPPANPGALLEVSIHTDLTWLLNLLNLIYLYYLFSGGSGIKPDTPSHTTLINMVFALHATASHSIVKCYYDLSKRLGVALRHEEKRCSYVTQETKIMITAHDEFSTR